MVRKESQMSFTEGLLHYKLLREKKRDERIFLLSCVESIGKCGERKEEALKTDGGKLYCGLSST